MAVTANAGDSAGASIDAAITSLNASITHSPAGSQQLAAYTTALDDVQNRAVLHYLGTGRLQASAIISTLSLVAPPVHGQPGAADLSNTTNRLSALTTSAAIAGPQQTTNQQLLAAAQTELVYQCLANKTVLASTILSSLS